MKGGVEVGGIVLVLTKNEDLTTGAQKALPKKCRDPEIFSVPCTIGDCTFADAMLDLGASINVMPTSIYKSLNFGDLEPTRMTIQLANRSVVQPLGVLEDVLVRVNEMIFPADFYVLDMEDDTLGKGSTLILGRLFLMTARTKINVHVRMFLMEFGDTLVQFNIFEAVKHLTEDHSHVGIDLIDELVEEPIWIWRSNFQSSRQQLHKEHEDKLLHVLRQHKKAIGWKLSDLQGINLSICMHIILIEEETRPIRQQQRRLNPTILDMVKKEVTKRLAARIIYPISDSQWISLVQVVPKKFGMIVMKNQHNELVPMRIHNNWRVCIDYRRLNQATRKDHFPLPFIDQFLEKLVGKSHYYFLDGFSRYMQIHIKTTFTCPFGTFAYTRMPFGLYNASSTFERCMTSIFSDLLQECMEVFMDDFTMYADSFDACLENLSKVLTRCIDTNLVLNFEKCHFMVIEGIMLGHLVSNRGIDVGNAKIDIITSLPNLASVQEVHLFLGHARFYKRFIKNLCKIALPLSKLLQKDPYVEAFQVLKNRFTSAPILQAPNWELPFELMCDTSNLALGTILGQRVGAGKPVHVITYASRTMDPAQLNYTTTKKELLTIIFALENFRSYLLGSKIIVFFDHAALRFLLKKPNANGCFSSKKLDATLKYLLKKLDAKPRVIWWMLLLQEFDLEIRDKGPKNIVADYLSWLEREADLMPIQDEFPDKQIL
ncbi:Retrovirus-related Pol polyprotein, partial [Mucuna pruriens]